jgi:hypothetical protein
MYVQPRRWYSRSLIRDAILRGSFRLKWGGLTQSRPDDFAVTRILVRAALEADGEDGEEGYTGHGVWKRELGMAQCRPGFRKL